MVIDSSNKDALNVSEPRGFSLSTIGQKNKPSSRIVFLKSIDTQGVILSSSELSQKGKDIRNNSFVAVTLWWMRLCNRLIFFVIAHKLMPEISDDIFADRIKEAQALDDL